MQVSVGPAITKHLPRNLLVQWPGHAAVELLCCQLQLLQDSLHTFHMKPRSAMGRNHHGNLRAGQAKPPRAARCQKRQQLKRFCARTPIDRRCVSARPPMNLRLPVHNHRIDLVHTFREIAPAKLNNRHRSVSSPHSAAAG